MSKSNETDDSETNPTAEQQQPERLFSAQTVADLIEGSVPTVRRLVDDGVLKAVYVRGSLRIRESSYLAFVKTGTRPRKAGGARGSTARGKK
jgi:excisionase family DNA binding protein